MRSGAGIDNDNSTCYLRLNKASHGWLIGNPIPKRYNTLI